MMMQQRLRTATVVSLILLVAAATGAHARVIEVTDDNFDALTKDGAPLFLDIYAPWCSHCQRLEPVWRALASELKPHGVAVGRVDGTRNPVLRARFAVRAYPSLFLTKGAQTWQYEDARGLEQLKEFALSGYKDAPPLPYHKSPVSPVGRAVGALHALPGLARRAYAHLRHDRGFGDLTIVAGALAVPLFVGGVAICVLDAVVTRRQHFDVDGGAHAHYE